MTLNDAADDAVTQPFGGGVYGNDEPLCRFCRLCRFSRLLQNHVLARRHLPPVEVLHRPGDQQQLTRLDGAIQKRLSGPGALDHTGGVLQHGSEDPQAPSRGQHALRDHPAHQRHLPANGRARDRRHGRGIEIAERDVIQEILDRGHTQSRERGGADRTHAFEVLDGTIRPEHGANDRRNVECRISNNECRSDCAVRYSTFDIRYSTFPQSPTRRSAKVTGSNTSRSSNASPMPRNRSGTSSSRRRATTDPPRAVPSSLVTTSPLSGSAAANALPCCTAFCPMVASSTSSVSCGAPSHFRAITRRIFLSSSMRSAWVCS